MSRKDVPSVIRLRASSGRRGFTLAELLVTLVLSGITISSMVAFFVSQAQGSRVASIRIEAIQRTRFAAEMLRREISLADPF